jgi:hypothetical protein
VAYLMNLCVVQVLGVEQRNGQLLFSSHRVVKNRSVDAMPQSRNSTYFARSEFFPGFPEGEAVLALSRVFRPP